MKMMYKLFLCAIGATMLFSCVKENFEEPQENLIPEGYEIQKFTATTSEADQPSNKTTIEVNDDGTHGATLWSEGDQLGVYGDGVTPDEFKYVLNYQAIRGINIFNIMVLGRK